jgi:N-acetylmuramic acid 6-phosphate (MurNAc-6-P) etherase
VSDLRAVIAGARAEGAPVMVIGVTCGMSAPYVAAQLDFVLDQIGACTANNSTVAGAATADATRPRPLCDFTPVLVGFNPVALARDIPIEMWSNRPEGGTHTFRDVARRMEAAADDAIIINPVVGPESLCGSTRMKGGTATKIILETVFGAALESVLSASEPAADTGPTTTTTNTNTSIDTTSIDTALYRYADAITAAYAPSTELGRLIDICGTSLRSTHGRIFYLGGDPVAAIVGFIDASEMRPTFGAPADETRGFAEHGWESLGNVEGDLTGVGPLYKVDFASFRDVVMQTLTADDTVVALHCESSGGATDALVSQARAETGCQIVRLSVSRRQKHGTAGSESAAAVATAAASATATVAINWVGECDICLPHGTPTSIFDSCPSRNDAGDAGDGDFSYRYDGYGALCLKVALNALSTGAQVMAGRTLSNRMINVTPSNHKLFLRCTGLVKLLANMNGAGAPAIGEDEARRCLIRAIYETDDATRVEELLSGTPVSEYIKEANRRGSVQRANKLLPIAILVAVKRGTVSEAKRALATHTTVREALEC